MTEAAPAWLGLAALDFSSLQGIFAFGLRLLVAAAGAILGWLLAGPVFRLLYRLAFQRPAPGTALTFARLAGALLVGIILFFYYPFGLGGSGGWGDGDGPGKGKGKGSNGTADSKKVDPDGKDKKKDPSNKSGWKGDVLPVEMIVSERYEPGSGRWYLVAKERQPKTLKEVESYLEKNKDRVGKMEIIIYKNSPEPGHYAVKALEDLAGRLNLPYSKPPEYQTKKKEPPE